MQHHDGFIIRWESAKGKVYRAYVPPTAWPTGPERRQAAELERQKAIRARAFVEYAQAIGGRDGRAGGVSEVW